MKQLKNSEETPDSSQLFLSFLLYISTTTTQPVVARLPVCSVEL